MSAKKKQRGVLFSIEDKAIKLYDKKQTLLKLTPFVPEGDSLMESNRYGTVRLEWRE